MRNVKLTIEYDGTAYHGWQVQPGLRTIQGVIQEKIAQITQEDVNLIGAGRTDAGVHALGQVANCRIKNTIDLESLQRGLNSVTPPDIVVKEAETVTEDFHARFSATSKTYEYVILNQRYPSAIWRNYSWFLPYDLDVPTMKKCGAILLGTHDFSSFRASGDDSRHSIRNVIRFDIEDRTNNIIILAIEANAFLREMVRAIVGTLVDVGRRKISADEFSVLFRALDRQRAGMTAPARGLFLKKVTYEKTTTAEDERCPDARSEHPLL